ncbi:MAG: GIY-YIG nuclease family protein [Candidatus Moraniibacteriota bacterium]
MYYVYIAKSARTGKLYIGCTNDLRKRIKEHNNNKSLYTKFKGPWETRYYEAFYSKEDAFEREQKLKRHARGLQELKKRIKRSIDNK